MKYPLKLIEWHDAHNSNHDWIAAESLLEETKQVTVQTIGFEVLRTDSQVTLAMSVASNEDLCDLFTIPLAMIVREQTFRRRSLQAIIEGKES